MFEVYTPYHWIILFLAVMFAFAAMLELRSKLVAATMAFTSILCIAVLVLASPANAATAYTIEAAVNDETFIINGEVFKAKLYCMGWDEGDEVVFLDGSPSGVCVAAELFNMTRHDSCSVWCE